MFYIYFLKSRKDQSTYIGYTKNKAPFDLIYYESYKSKSDAKYRENNLKRFAQAYTQLKRRIRNSLE